jgi:hypothetical protein
MGMFRVARVALAAAAAIAFGHSAQSEPSKSSAVSLQKNGAMLIAGRSLRCQGVRNLLDARLPNLGIAAPGLLVMNPDLLRRHSETVRLFVYHHECGHHHIGGSELKADCWAVNSGVRDGWLNKERLGEVCRSFGKGPATETHPSGVSRCKNIDRCFATASAAQTRLAVAGAPKLVAGPTLVSTGKTSGVAVAPEKRAFHSGMEPPRQAASRPSSPVPQRASWSP